MPEDCGHHSVTYFSVIIINDLIYALVYFCSECLVVFCFVLFCFPHHEDTTIKKRGRPSKEGGAASVGGCSHWTTSDPSRPEPLGSFTQHWGDMKGGVECGPTCLHMHALYILQFSILLFVPRYHWHCHLFLFASNLDLNHSFTSLFSFYFLNCLWTDCWFLKTKLSLG